MGEHVFAVFLVVGCCGDLAAVFERNY